MKIDKNTTVAMVGGKMNKYGMKLSLLTHTSRWHQISDSIYSFSHNINFFNRNRRAESAKKYEQQKLRLTHTRNHHLIFANSQSARKKFMRASYNVCRYEIT